MSTTAASANFQAGVQFLQHAGMLQQGTEPPAALRAQIEAIGADVASDQTVNTAGGRDAFVAVAGQLGRNVTGITNQNFTAAQAQTLAPPRQTDTPGTRNTDNSGGFFDKIANFFKENPILGFGGLGLLIGAVTFGLPGLLVGGALGAMGGFMSGEMFPETFGNRRTTQPPPAQNQTVTA
jgi:hypothetical protein